MEVLPPIPVFHRGVCQGLNCVRTVPPPYENPDYHTLPDVHNVARTPLRLAVLS